MRVPIPERFPAKWVGVFAATLLVVQLAEGTNPIFAMLCLVYVCLFAIAFNAAGGFYYPSGAWILLNGVLTLLLGLVYKCFLREPAESHLLSPLLSLSVYCVGMAGFGVAAYLSRVLRPKAGLLEKSSQGEQMKKAAIGCLVFGVLLTYATLGGDRNSASIASALSQLNHFIQMAIILGTVYEIHASRGRRSSNWIVWTAGIWVFLNGMVYFSKEGIFAGLTTWIVPAVVLRFNFSRSQVVGLLAVLALGSYYLVPYSQIGRQSRDSNGIVGNNAKAALVYLGDLEGTRKQYLELQKDNIENDSPHFFTGEQGLFDRLQMISFDDSIIHYTEQGNQYGLLPVYSSVANAVPHFLWRNKPNFNAANVYGREIGVLDEDDYSTSVSFSPLGDAFHEIGWLGVVFLSPLILFLLFFVADSLSGDVRKSPWGLLYIALFTHVAPEGMLAGQIYMLTYGSEAVIFVTLLARYVMPVITSLISGGEKTRVRQTMQFTPAPRRAAPGPDPAAAGPL